MRHSTDVQLSNLAGRPYLSQVLPIDVAKSRLQVARPGSQCDISLLQNLRLLHKERESPCCLLASSVACSKAYSYLMLTSNISITAAGGFRGLYTGLSLVQTRAFPANAAQW
jgi:Mitochondrial carrier protein